MDKSKGLIKRVYDFLDVFIPMITFCVIFVTFLITIISRYVFRTPVTWSYEVSVLGYMWTMFFGVGKAMEHDEHVVFGLIYDKHGPLGQFIYKAVYNIFLVILLALCVIPCFRALTKAQMVTGVLKLPYMLVFAPFMYMLADSIMQSIFNVKRAYNDYRAAKEGEAQ